MIGAIAGDMIGAPYEHSAIKHKDFFIRVAGFTDDSVLTVAVAQAIMDGLDYADALKDYANRYPRAGYGGGFRRWMVTWENKPYGSFGNGAAMRVSPVGFAFDTVEKVLKEAKRSAAVSHDHPEGVKGAQATALTILMARQGESKKSIRAEIAGRFGYDLDRTVDGIRPGYSFDVSCQVSVPESIIAFLDSGSWGRGVGDAPSL
jgi:ADP-ribosylglycohydrolase